MASIPQEKVDKIETVSPFYDEIRNVWVGTVGENHGLWSAWFPKYFLTREEAEQYNTEKSNELVIKYNLNG